MSFHGPPPGGRKPAHSKNIKVKRQVQVYTEIYSSLRGRLRGGFGRAAGHGREVRGLEGVPAVAAKAAADAQEGLAVVERAGEEMVVGLAVVIRN